MRLFALIAGVIGLPLLLVLARVGTRDLADPYKDIKWSDLAAGTTYHDQPVRLHGFVLPFQSSDQPVAAFFLTPSPVKNITEPLPPRDQLIWVNLEDGEITPGALPITIWGILESGTFAHEGIEAGHQLVAHGWEVYRAPLPGEN